MPVLESELNEHIGHAEPESRLWQAQMIAPLADAGQGSRASFVSHNFDYTFTQSPAILHISAQGLYRGFINNCRIGNDQLTPGWMCYDNRIAYQSYDVSDMLQEGNNSIVIWLGDGWFRSQVMGRQAQVTNCWGERIAAIAELEAGGNILFASSNSWGSGLLPVMQSGIYYGEDYDARLEELVVTDSVETFGFDNALLRPAEIRPIQELTPFEPVDSWSSDKSTFYDFGQNVGGYVRFTVVGEAGSTVRVEHSEVLGPKGEFDNRNYRDARAEIRYTLKGGCEETYAPCFTFMGYRYVCVTIVGAATMTDIVSVPISSVPEASGGFTCAVTQVNRLVQNTIWSQRANFIEVPTDCPQRDERLGWTGDAQVFAGTACWLADSERFLRKYLRDVMHDQRADGAISHFSPDPTRLHPEKVSGEWAGATGWGDVITVMPWQLYLHYGDDSVLYECFPAMRRWVDYLWSIGEGPIVLSHTTWGKKGFTFGDWLQPVGDNRLPRPTISTDCAATIYHFISTDLAARIAGVIGDAEAQAQLEERAGIIRNAFAHEFISPSGRLAHNDQTSYALATLYDLIPAEHLAAAKTNFRQVIVDAKGLIGTGFIGTPALLPALSKMGMNDLAELVFLNRNVPGWLYQVDMGATTIWERWDAMGSDGKIFNPAMNSFNHYAYGSVCQWLFESVAGIAPTAEAAGFNRVVLAPQILPQLSPVSAWHVCRHGKIEASWQLDGIQVNYDVTLPASCDGLLIAGAEQSDYTVDGRAVTIPATGLVLPPGSHHISFEITQ